MPLRAAVLLVLLFGGIFPVEGALAQAWLRAPGEVMARVAYHRSDATERYGTDGTVQPYSPFITEEAYRDRSFFFHGELGLTDAVTLAFVLPYTRFATRDEYYEYRIEAPGTARIGLRIGILPLFFDAGPHVLSANLAAGLPMGYTRNLRPSAGPGQVDLSATLDYGFTYRTLQARAGVGYQRRTPWFNLSRATVCEETLNQTCTFDRRPDFDDEWLFSAEAHFTFNQLAQVRLMSAGIWSLHTPDVAFNPSNPHPTRRRFMKVGGGVTLFPLRNLGLSVDVWGTPYGRNVIRSVDWQFGVEYRLPLW